MKFRGQLAQKIWCSPDIACPQTLCEYIIIYFAHFFTTVNVFCPTSNSLTDWLIDLMIVAWQLGEGTSQNIFPSPVVAKQLCTMITWFPTWASLLFLCPYVFTDIINLFLSLKLWHTTHLPNSQGYNALIIASSCCTVPLLTWLLSYTVLELLYEKDQDPRQTRCHLEASQ